MTEERWNYSCILSLEKNNARKFSYDKTVHVCEYVSRKKPRKKKYRVFYKMCFKTVQVSRSKNVGSPPLKPTMYRTRGENINHITPPMQFVAV